MKQSWNHEVLLLPHNVMSCVLSDSSDCVVALCIQCWVRVSWNSFCDQFKVSRSLPPPAFPTTIIGKSGNQGRHKTPNLTLSHLKFVSQSSFSILNINCKTKRSCFTRLLPRKFAFPVDTLSTELVGENCVCWNMA